MAYQMNTPENRALYNASLRIAQQHHVTAESIAFSDALMDLLMQDEEVLRFCPGRTREWVKRRLTNLRKNGQMFTLTALSADQ